MKKILIMFSLICFAAIAHAQPADQFQENARFKGATAGQEQYKAIYQLDSKEPAVIEKAIRNIKNVLEDPRLKGKLQVELIAFSGGTDAYLKGSPYEADLKKLVEQGVIVAQCENTLKERKIPRSELYDFIALVPTGNGELIIREAQGWAIVKP